MCYYIPVVSLPSTHFTLQTFDDAKHRLHLDGKDERSAAKYVSEGEQAVRMLDGLKTRVRETADSVRGMWNLLGRLHTRYVWCEIF